MEKVRLKFFGKKKEVHLRLPFITADFTPTNDYTDTVDREGAEELCKTCFDFKIVGYLNPDGPVLPAFEPVNNGPVEVFEAEDAGSDGGPEPPEPVEDGTPDPVESVEETPADPPPPVEEPDENPPEPFPFDTANMTKKQIAQILGIPTDPHSVMKMRKDQLVQQLKEKYGDNRTVDN